MKICPRCGRPNESSNRFCDFCGTQFPDSVRYKPKNQMKTALTVVVAMVLAIFVVGAGMLMIKKAIDSNTTGPGSDPGQQTASAAGSKEEAQEEPGTTTQQEPQTITQQEPEKETQEEPTESEPAEEEPAESEPVQEEPEPVDVPEHSFIIPSGALSYNGHHYYIYEDVRGSWYDAMDACTDREGYLAVINDWEENEALYNYMINRGFDQAYFGITDEDNEGEWVYKRGDESTFTDWGTNSVGTVEPNNADGGESHAMLDVNMHNGHWNDAQYGRKIYTPDGESYKDRYAYICEWDF